MSFHSTIIPAASFDKFGLRMVLPYQQLSTWVQCLWVLHKSPSFNCQLEDKLYPDAGSSLMFIYGDNEFAVRYFNYTQVVSHCLDTSLNYVSVRFNPGAARALLGISALECENEELDLINSPSSVRDELYQLAEAMVKLPMEQQLNAVQHWLLKRVMKSPKSFSKWSNIITQASTGSLAPTELADKFGFSRRTLERQIRNHTGCSPHQLCEFGQINLARRQLIQTSDSLSTIALDCGYYDQAHFTNAFRDHTWETPLKYRMRKLSQISNR
tara:strand:- start:800 stop:1609 length:810 start_codon:yes stop_codon:yes gene_type:complete